MIVRPSSTALAKSLLFRRQRYSQAGLGEIILKAGRVRRVRGNGGDVRHQVFRAHGCLVLLLQEAEQLRRQVRLARRAIAPKRENATAKGTFVVVEIGNQSRDRKGRARERRSPMKCRQVNLRLRVCPPQFRVGPIDNAVIRDEPLAVKGAEAVSYRWKAVTPVAGDGLWIVRETGSPFATTRLTCRSPKTPWLRCGTNNASFRSAFALMRACQRRGKESASGAMTQVRPGMTPEPS